MKCTSSLLLASIMLVGSSGCASNMPSIKPVEHVDLSRYMGDWYVIASIPSRPEKHAYNAVETYTLKPDGDVATAFHFREGSFDGEKKEIDSTGIVTQGSGNAVWGVRPFWPLKLQYIVAYLKDDYSQVIVARDKRDYVWVMARTPTLSTTDYNALISRVGKMGYAIKDIRKVPQE